MRRYEDPQISSSLFMGVMAVLVVVLIVVLVQALFLRMEKDELARKNLPGLGEEASLLRRSQAVRLESYAAVEGADGVFRVPIERAMELVIEEYGR